MQASVSTNCTLHLQAVQEFFLCLAHSRAAFLRLAADAELHQLVLGGMAASVLLPGADLYGRARTAQEAKGRTPWYCTCITLHSTAACCVRRWVAMWLAVGRPHPRLAGSTMAGTALRC